METLGKNLFDIFPEMKNETNISIMELVMKGADEVHLEEAYIVVQNTNMLCKPLVHGEDENTGLLLISGRT